VIQEEEMSVMRRTSVLSDEVKVAAVSAICLLSLVVVLKNVLDVSTAVLSRDVIIFIIAYSAFWMIPALDASREKKSRFERPLFWSLMIVAVTAAIIAVYVV
jgi:hypothetical protein